MSQIKWLPTLYKFDAKGKLRMWRCGTEGNSYVTEYGDVWNKDKKRGKLRQTEPKTIEANARESSAEKQAENYTKQSWDEKQRKDSYYPSEEIPTCTAEEWLEMHDDTRKWPALCKAWGDVPAHEKVCTESNPWIGQYKIDGNRVTAWYKNDELKLYSRTCQELKFKDHLRDQLIQVFNIVNFLITGETGHFKDYPFGLDGEIWIPKSEFHQQSHSVSSRTVNKSDRDEEQCFAWFDIIDYVSDFSKRSKLMLEAEELIREDIEGAKAKREIGMNQESLCLGGSFANIFPVPTSVLINEDVAQDFYEQAKKIGFEGVVLRRPEQKYPKHKNTRHNDMVKMKPAEDAEFEVIGFDQASGDRAGCVVWKLRNDLTNDTFSSSQMGTIEFQRELYLNAPDFIGRKITIRYTERSAEQIPKQPRAKVFRPDWDLDVEEEK
jgi:hypothetical protein